MRITGWAIMGACVGVLAAQAVAPPSSTEFQPIVDADKHRLQVIASVTYKFF